jgi:hypothetical protein
MAMGAGADGSEGGLTLVERWEGADLARIVDGGLRSWKKD